MISIIVQIYWNYKNYIIHKNQFIQTTQQSLDNAVDSYFSEKAKKEFHFSSSKNHFDLSNEIDSIQTVFSNMDQISSIKIQKKPNVKLLTTKLNALTKFPKALTINTDSLNKFNSITSIWISINEKNINIKKLKTLLLKELKRKKIKMPFKINHYLDNDIIATSDSLFTIKNPIKTISKAVFLKENEQIELVFPNQLLFILKSGFVGILLSLILSIAIIISLFYLLNVIKKQKQVAEIKNDFISNITHEFKTPITTIGLATEAIIDYNKQNNKAKANEYLNITKSQLQKLSLMVEKVLETSTLDNSKLLLNKEPINLVKLLNNIVKNHPIPNTKNINFSSNVTDIIIDVDIFHFENAINNLIDNAIKYGGDKIEINLQLILNTIEITIADNGTINKQYHNSIFDKFYRIPKGNTHDVKGFGIGLYYTKNIIEKHQGILILEDTKNTLFKITLSK